VVAGGASAQVNHPLAPCLSRRGITRGIFMHSGEPKAHGIFAQNDRRWPFHLQMTNKPYKEEKWTSHSATT
jgi:hypothetical protein